MDIVIDTWEIYPSAQIYISMMKLTLRRRYGQYNIGVAGVSFCQ